MAELGTTWEREDLGAGKFRHIQNLRPIAYSDGGILRRIVSDWVDGDATFPHVVSAAQLKCYTAADGMRRLCPTGEADRYIEIGAPYIKPATQWQKVNLGTASRSANALTWTTANAVVNVLHAGHYVKLAIELLNGWQPPNGQVAFPVGLSGLTRTGDMLYRDGVTVAHLRVPVAYDAAVRDDVRPITHDFVRVGGQNYLLLMLPSLAGMTRPVIDPTLTLQPDAAAGVDTSVVGGAMADPTLNYGVSDRLRVQRQTTNIISKSLLRFDLSSIPAGSTIDSGNQYLYHYDANYGLNFNVNSHVISNVNGDWIEGTKDGALAGVNEPCWNAKKADGAGGVTTAWAGSAGLETSGTDYTAAACGSFSGNSSDAVGTEYAVSLNVTQVQGLLTNNNGFLMNETDADSVTQNFCSSDHATAGYRPKLVVEYTEAAAGNPWYAYAQM